MSPDSWPRSPAPAARVLVVDDDEHVGIIIRALLMDAGYEVDIALDGLQGLDSARKCRPDLIISDLQMPRMGGLEFRREALRDPRLAETPFLFITAYQESLETLAGILQSEDRALHKPIEPADLLRVLEELVRPGARS